jgi:hypothetical protein
MQAALAALQQAMGEIEAAAANKSGTVKIIEVWFGQVSHDE